MNAIIGRKLGMTRVFDDNGLAIPVTVIEAGPCAVVQVRSHDGGSQSVQIGFGARKAKRTTKALAGHVKASGLYGFKGWPASHGSTTYRRPGSMGPGTDPSRVIKGKKLPGHYGAARHTEVGLEVVRVDAERNLLYVRGAVPGPKTGIVTVRKQGGRGRYA